MINGLRNSIYFISIFFATCLLQACGERIVYHTYRPVPAKRWAPSDTLVYEVEISDSAVTLTLTAEVRNRNTYPFQNLTLNVASNFSDTARWVNQKADFILTDEEGQWKGTGWGSLYSSGTSLGHVYIARPGTYTIRVTHDMRTEELEGIQDVGIRLAYP
ncbi:MAG: gliding motility lipoprotein GldH [Bacteroides sp.]|nr:gliding motility lipoprotein GldH [Bacteroides sp.]